MPLHVSSTCAHHQKVKIALHVEAWNKLIVKQKFCASSWLITEIKTTYIYFGKGIAAILTQLHPPLLQSSENIRNYILPHKT